MPVPTSIADLSTTAIANSPQGTDTAKGTIDDYFRAHASFIAQNRDALGGKVDVGDLDALQLADYASLRAYSGSRKAVYISSYLVTAAPGNTAGMFVLCGAGAPAAADNDGTVIVGVGGRIWKRVFDGDVDIGWFGATLDGVASDTAALQKVVTALKADKAHSRVLINGILAFDPTAIDYTGLTDKLTYLVNGSLKPTTTIVLTSNFQIEGIGGAGAGAVQFTVGACCAIIPPVGNIPVIRVASANDQTLKNISIYGCYQGIYADGAGQLGALLRMENVNILANVAGGIAFVIDAFFWVWADNCRFLTTAAALKSILITNTSVANSQAGLIFLKNCITATRGISINPTLGACSNIYFQNHHHESLPAGEDFCYAKSGTFNLTFDQLGISDSLGAGSYTFDLAGVKAFRILNSQPQSFRNIPDRMINETDTPYDYTNTTRNIGSGSAHSSAQHRGLIHGRLMARGHINTAPVGVGVPLAITIPSGVFGNLTFTPAQTGPDGTATATKVEYTGAGIPTDQASKTMYQAGRVVAIGDILILSGMIKMLDTTSGGNSDTGILEVGIVGSTALGTSLTGQARSAGAAPPAGLDHALADDGWMAVTCAYKITAAGTPDIVATAILRKASSGFLLWKPNIRVIPAAYGFGNADAARLTQAFGGMHTAPAGVVSVMEHQALRSGIDITANRPSAVAVAKGAQFFDSTLNKPIWSDGAVWRDAAGTAV